MVLPFYCHVIAMILQWYCHVTAIASSYASAASQGRLHSASVPEGSVTCACIRQLIARSLEHYAPHHRGDYRRPPRLALSSVLLVMLVALVEWVVLVVSSWLVVLLL